YALWEVIKNGNSWVSVSQTTQENGSSVTKMSIPVTAEEKTNKKNDVKARSLLFMALPNEHQLTFSQYSDAKTMFAAIEIRFGGNEATRKKQKTLLKQQYENFNASSTESLDSIFKRLQKIVSRLTILGVVITQEDLNLIFLRSLPPKCKESVGASTGAQNMAFMTAPSTSSTNDVNTVKPAYEVSTVSPNVNIASPQVSTANFSDNVVYAFMVENPNGSNLLQQDLEQIHEDDLEAIDLKWQLSLLSMRAKRYFQRTGKKIFINANDTAGYQDNTRKQGNNEDTSSKAMLAIDGVGFDWSDMAEEQVQTNMALMVILDSEVNNDKTCTKTCLKTYETLKKQCDDLIVKLNQTEFKATTYKRGLTTVEEQLVTYRKNEVLFSEEVAVLKREVACKDYEISVLKSEFEKVKQEKEGIEFKIKKFDNASKSLDKLLGSQITDKSKKGLGYNVVPPPHHLIYNAPTKLDLSYSGLDEFKEPEFKSYGPRDSNLESNIDKKSDNSKENTDDSLINCHHHQRKRMVFGNNYNRVDYDYYAKTSHPSAHRNMVPRAVLLKSGLTPLNTTRPVYIAQLKPTVHSARSMPRAVNTARPYTALINAIRTKGVNVVKTLACWVWRPTRPNGASLVFKRNNYIDGKPQLDDKRLVDNGCSRHMTGNIAYLSDFKEFDGGYVTFGGGTHGGRIFGKGTLKTDCLDFEDVYFVNELKFNLFSVSQMCDKKKYVIFTDTECLVLSPNFKFPDKSQILFKIPRKDNMYSFDMKNIVPKENLTCLVAKATLDESMLWHRRLGHINFKNINKLVKENLVRGLPTKCFENDQTCIACLKGKQHKASCKSKVLNPITKPLFMLHMDLFAPTFMSSLMHKTYCLLVTDDYSRFTWVFFLATKDETNKILKNFIKEIENLVDKKVKIIRCHNRTELKNKVMNDFCREKGIRREYSVARTPQQNGAEAVSTACYVHNRVLVVKPHNKTPYELFRGFKPALSFMRPFGCHVTILNTLDNLGKFDGKSDEGFFVGYSLSSKAFRVYNTRTRKVEENLHIGFLENKPMIEGNGPKWLFDIDSLTQSMNYVPVAAGTITNESAGTQGDLNAGTSTGKEGTSQDYIVMPIWKDASYFDSLSKDVGNDEPKSAADDIRQVEDGPHNESDDKDKSEDDSSPKEDNAAGQHINTASPEVNTGRFEFNIVDPLVNTTSSYDLHSLKDMFKVGASHTLEATPVEFFRDEDEPEVNLGNIPNSYTVLTTPNTRIHKDHLIKNVIGDVKSSVQTRRMTRSTSAQGFLSAVYEEKTHDTMNTCLYACFLSQIEPTSIAKALSDSSIKARLVAQGHRQEEGIDYEEVFAPVAIIEPIRLFLAYASFMSFLVYQMDVKSAFLYGTIKEEVYVTQPLGFKDPNYPDKVYKVVKALYGLHQAPRAWYETLANYLLGNGFQRGKIDHTLFIKKQKGDILLVQVYVDDIIFGSTNKELCIAFEKLMKDKFQMSSIGELTFFLGLQVKQKEDGIFISQDKYVAEILNKFNYTDVKSASTPVDLEKPLVKDGDVDVHLYRSMIGSLMYLTASRPDIMFTVCACARFQVTPKTSHLLAIKRIFRYLKGKPTLGLWYSKDSQFELVAYTDSDYAGATQDRKSTTGGYQFLGNSTLDSKSIAGLWVKHIEYLMLNASPLKHVKRGRDTKIPQSSGPPVKVGDEAVHKELGDRMERAATTASSLEAEQDSGNINKTQSMATLNGSSP
ncbi:putative ribonuclease H-like domain-containing protein, partial [Tanacetum coccineum]